MIKLSTVATDMMGVSGRAMIEALIAGERDPQVLADLARGRLRVKHAALVEALTGRFDAHHAELARMILDGYDTADAQIRRLSERIEALIAALPAAQGVHADGTTGPASGNGQDAPVLPVLARLDQIPGVGPKTAQVIVAEIGLDMTRFPTDAHLVSWSRLSPRTVQSGPRSRAGKTGKGNPYLKGVLGEAAAAAAKTDTFLGARYRRLVKRRGKLKALVAVARSSSPSSGICSPTQPPATKTSEPTTTPAGSTPPAAPTATSANSKPSATKSPSPPPDRGHQRLTVQLFSDQSD